MGSRIQLQQRNCSRFARDFSRRSTDQTRKELPTEVAACASALKIYLSGSPKTPAVHSKKLNFLVTGGAGFIGSNLALALQEKYPDARLTVIDDFRSGDFKNLAGLSRRLRGGRSGLARLARAIRRRRNSTAFFISRRSPTRRCTISFRRCMTTWRAFAASPVRAAEPDACRLRVLGRDLRRGQRREPRSGRSRPGECLRFLQGDHGQSRAAGRRGRSGVEDCRPALFSMFTVRAKRTKACRRA